MFSYLLKRVFLLIPILLVVASLVFFLLHLSPGDPVDFILGENADVSKRQELIENYGLDKPLYTQYKNYITQIFSGNLGSSIHHERPVLSLIQQHYRPTLELAAMAVFWALVISFPLGIFAAVKKYSKTDKSILMFSLLGFAIPNFYLGPILALFFSIYFDILPVSGRELPGSIILPSLTLGIGMAAILTRMVRVSLIEVLEKDYIRTARAKGLSAKKILLKHGLRSALIPVVAIVGLQLGVLLTGTIVTEKIFSWPGLGSLMLDSINRRDYPVVQGCILIITTTYVVVNLLTDFVYTWLDPRLKIHE